MRLTSTHVLRFLGVALLTAASLRAQAQGPALTGRQPARNAVAAPRTGPLTLTFSQAVAAASAPNLRVYGGQLRGRRSGNLAGGGTTTLTFAPAQAFAPGERVSVSVPASLTGTGGAAATPQVYQFTAAAGGTGLGLFLDTTTVGRTSSRDQLLGDLDNDGDLDLVSSGGLFGMYSFLNNGSGTFTPLGGVTMANTPSGAALGDFNQDGILDLVVGDADNATVAIALGTGTGTFGLAGFATQTLTVGGRVAGVAVGDVDGDGDLDFVSANSGNSTASVGLNDGTGHISGVTSLNVGILPSAIQLADIDNDGDLDLLTSDRGSFSVSVRLNNGRGTFSGQTSLTVGANPSDLAVGDFDGDGDLDLVTTNAGEGNLSVYWNAGGSFTTTVTIPVAAGSAPTGVAVGDVDADGDLDLVVAHGTGGRLTTFRNNGSGTFTALPDPLILAGPGSLPAQSLGVTLGDVDGDLDLDVVTAEGNLGRVVLGRNSAPPTLTAFSPGSGVPGDVLTLTGTNLAGTRSILFGGSLHNEVRSGFTINAAGTQISGVVVPPGAGTGPLSLAAGGGLALSASAFVLNAPQLAVLQNATPLPPAGAGYDFGELAQGSLSAPVTFTLRNPGSQPLTISGLSVTGPFALSGPAPTSIGAGAAATVAVRFQPTTTGALTGSLLVTSNAAGYPSYAVTLRGTGIVPPPQITSFSPSSVPQGTTLTINGANLFNTSVISFSGFNTQYVRSGFVINAAGTQLEVEVPLGAGTGPLTLTTPTGTVTRQLTVLQPLPPVVTSLGPDNGIVGTPLTITGANFLGATSVRFDNTVQTQFRVVNSTTITTTFTGSSSGSTPLVRVETPSGLSNGLPFRAVPVIMSIQPRVPVPGARVEVYCRSCNDATSLLFNGSPLPFTFISGILTFTAPTTAGSGWLSVVTPNGTSNSLYVTIGRQPELTGIAPGSGAAGTVLTLTGANLQGATAVTFTGPGQNAVTSGFTVNAAGTQISGVVVPPGAATGPVVVTTPNGTGYGLGLNFTVSSPAVTVAPPWSSLLTLTGSPTQFGGGTVAAVVSDASGNIYVAGSFYGQLRFGSIVLQGPSFNTTQGFVAKWSRAANTYAWALQENGPGSVFTSLAVQGSSVYVGGAFGRNGVFGNISFLNRTSGEAFVAKITDQGTSASFTWVEASSGTCSEGVTSLVLQNGSLYVAGGFGDEVSESRTGVFGPFSVVGQDKGDVFVAKLSDLGSSGRYEWVVAAGGSGPDMPRALSVSGNRIYIGGEFYGHDFRAGSTVLSSAIDPTMGYLPDGFVAQLLDQGSSASFTWARQLSGTGIDYISGVAARGSEVFVSGQYDHDATFGTARLGSLTAQGGTHGLVAKLTDAGNLVWLQPLQQPSSAYGLKATAVAVSNSHVYAAFTTGGMLQCGPYTTTTQGNMACHVVKLADLGGNAQVQWVQSTGGSGNSNNLAATLHVQGTTVYVGGRVHDPVTFGPFTSPSSADFYPFVATIGDAVLSSRPATAATALSLYPNPARHAVTVELPGQGAAASGQLTVLDALGRPVRRQPLTVPAAGLRQELDLRGLPAGVYVVRATAGALTATRRLVVE